MGRGQKVWAVTEEPTVAVLMACHNRRDQTMACLRALFASATNARIQVYLVDDGSTDGTSEALQHEEWPIQILRGDGNLYWAAAMALAERAAIVDRPEYLLWLNDDTQMDIQCLDTMLTVSGELADEVIVVGATRDPVTGVLTYGGRRRVSAWHPQRLQLLPSGSQLQDADTFNGNLVLVPMSVRRDVGPIDGLFAHAYADDDYGLRARAIGVRVVQVPGTVGSCPRPIAQAVTGRGWRKRQERKGLPWRSQVRYFRRHGGIAWPLLLAGQQASWLLIPGRSTDRGT